MNPTIEKIVNLLFEDLVETDETRALHEEVRNNCQERFSDLVADGLSEDDATAAVVESLKGMEEALRDHPRKAVQGGEHAFVAADVRAIEVNVSTEDVIFSHSADDSVHVCCGDNVTVSLQNGVLTLTQGKSTRGVGLHLRLLDWCLRLGDMSPVEVFVPQSLCADLTIRTSAGDVEMEDVKATTLNLHTTCGDVRLESVTADRLTLSATSGDLSAEGVDVLTEAQLTVTSGDVEWNGSCPLFTVSSASGDVEAEGAFANVRIVSISGDVAVTASSPALAGLVAKTTSGDVDVRLPAGLVADVKCRTLAGDAVCRVQSAPGGVPVEASSTSGDVTVR